MLLRLMADSVSTFCVLGRHALRLAGHPAPAVRRAVVAGLEQHFSIPGRSFYKLLDLREGKTKPRGVDPAPLLDEYLKEIGALITVVDRL